MTKPLIPTLVLAPVSALVLVSVIAAAPVPSEAPVAVSPGRPIGDATAATSEERCPTFSWGRVDGAFAYELAVYRIDDQGEVEQEPVLWQRIAGTALGWTPSLEHCPRRGERHAWSVRAVTPGGVSGWSAPLVFGTAAKPSDRELAWALEVVRRHAGERDLDAPPARAPSARTGGVDEIERGGSGTGVRSDDLPRGEEVPASDGIANLASPAFTLGIPTAHLTVAGEVRTIDPDDPTGAARLWGRGRVGAEVNGVTIFGVQVPCFQGALKYGLSTMAVDWGSAADACPAGTWVCTRSDGIGACNTNRPETTGGVSGRDWLECDGTSVDVPSDQHHGWVADPALHATNGHVHIENAFTTAHPTCSILPVWCCWE